MKTERELQQGVEQSRYTVNQSDEGGKYAISSISWIGDKMYIPGSMQEERPAVPHQYRKYILKGPTGQIRSARE